RADGLRRSEPNTTKLLSPRSGVRLALPGSKVSTTATEQIVDSPKGGTKPRRAPPSPGSAPSIVRVEMLDSLLRGRCGFGRRGLLGFPTHSGSAELGTDLLNVATQPVRLHLAPDMELFRD